MDYKGITVAEDTALRAEMRENERGVRRGEEHPGPLCRSTTPAWTICDDVLNGTTSHRHLRRRSRGCGQRVVAEFAKKLADQEKFVIKAGFMDGKVISVDEVKALADLPCREVLQAHGSGHPAGPHHQAWQPFWTPTSLSLARVMQAIADQKGA